MWGRGDATEAAGALLRFGFRELGIDKIIGFIFPDHIASRRVLEKAGLRETGVLDSIPRDHVYYSCTLFELNRAEFAD